MSQKKLLTKEQILQFANAAGWHVLNIDDFKNTDSKLQWACLNCCSVVVRTVDKFRTYHKCQKCKSTIWYINLQNSYKHFSFKARHKFRAEFICQLCKKEQIASISDFLQGKHCGCFLITPFTNVFEMWGYKVLRKISEATRNDRRKFEVKCPVGHKFPTQARLLQSGHGCPVCATQNAVTPK